MFGRGGASVGLSEFVCLCVVGRRGRLGGVVGMINGSRRNWG